MNELAIMQTQARVDGEPCSIRNSLLLLGLHLLLLSGGWREALRPLAGGEGRFAALAEAATRPERHLVPEPSQLGLISFLDTEPQKKVEMVPLKQRLDRLRAALDEILADA